MSDSLISWRETPEEHDYPAAEDYLRLLLPTKIAQVLVMHLQVAEPIHVKAKDLLRASELPLLPLDNEHVKNDLRKVLAGKQLSPILLISLDHKLLVADGYHRICLSYHIGENEDVPARLVYNNIHMVDKH